MIFFTGVEVIYECSHWRGGSEPWVSGEGLNVIVLHLKTQCMCGDITQSR